MGQSKEENSDQSYSVSVLPILGQPAEVVATGENMLNSENITVELLRLLWIKKK